MVIDNKVYTIFAVLVIVALATLLAVVMSKKKKVVHGPPSREKFESEPLVAGDSRVIGIFDTLFNRNPTPEELKGFRGMPEKEIIAKLTEKKPANVDVPASIPKVRKHTIDKKEKEAAKKQVAADVKLSKKKVEDKKNAKVSEEFVDEDDDEEEEDYGEEEVSGYAAPGSSRYAAIGMPTNRVKIGRVDSKIEKLEKVEREKVAKVVIPSRVQSGRVAFERDEFVKRLNIITDELTYFAKAVQ